MGGHFVRPFLFPRDTLFRHHTHFVVHSSNLEKLTLRFLKTYVHFKFPKLVCNLLKAGYEKCCNWHLDLTRKYGYQ
jgi:hypothetical protein